MIKKEVSEIKKQFTPQNCAISRICGCYVDADKEKKLLFKEAFLSLPEDDTFKYFEIFKQTLSGTIGKNLLNLDFPMKEEEEGGKQEFLLKLRNSKLEDDNLIEQFYDKIIEDYVYGENYLILLIHAAYDVPGKSTDGSRMFDASDNVYDFMLCSICPVNLSKPGLCYNNEKNNIEHRVRDWVVESPAKGFLFPVFNDRNSDIHSILYYSKNSEELQLDFIDQLLGCSLPISAISQKDIFNAIIADTLGDDCDYEIMKTIHENLTELMEEKKEEPEPLVLMKHDMKQLLEQSGVSEEKLQTFEEDYIASAGEKTALFATNLVNSKKFNIQTPDIVINVNPSRTDLIQTRIIDGQQCLVIAVDDHIEVNGVNARTIKPPSVLTTLGQMEEE